MKNILLIIILKMKNVILVEKRNELVPLLYHWTSTFNFIFEHWTPHVIQSRESYIPDQISDTYLE